MNINSNSPRFLIITLLILMMGLPSCKQKTISDNEPAGKRPYEMELYNRKPIQTPLVGFDSLAGWTVEGINGGKGEFLQSKKHLIWDSSGVGRLIYSGKSKQSGVKIIPAKPIRIPDSSDVVSVWIYGNNFDWMPDTTYPMAEPFYMDSLIAPNKGNHVFFEFRDEEGKTYKAHLMYIQWEEWFLAFRHLPKELRSKKNLSLTGIIITETDNKEPHELYFEDLCIYKEKLKPLKFDPRPKRNIALLPGQPAGLNTGPGTLPFPTRKETILPDNITKSFKTALIESKDDFTFSYKGQDVKIEYSIPKDQPYFQNTLVFINGKKEAKMLSGAGPVFDGELKNIRLVKSEKSKTEKNVIESVWEGKLGGKTIQVKGFARLWQKSLVVDYICTNGDAKELSYGYIEDIEKPELLILPYIAYRGHHLALLMNKGKKPFFASIWMDWYLCNSSMAYAIDLINGNQIRLNGGVKYFPKTDGKRNDMFERVFITFSPTMEETLPNIPNPPAKEGKLAGQRLWQETWGPKNYAEEHARSKKLRAYGIEMFTQLNHEITWRDDYASFTFRTVSAPLKGGDSALQNYIAGQRALGWHSGLYTTYTDFAPVNQYWDIDMAMRDTANDAIPGWPRCYLAKPPFAVQMDKILAPQIHEKFKTNAAYTDVHTSMPPWEREDYDARVPGAGTFAQTFYCYGELLLHDQKVYDGFCWSEGNMQWFYAGLCTGSYGLIYSDLLMCDYPYLPHFDLLKMHPLSVDIGIPWTEWFFEGTSESKRYVKNRNNWKDNFEKSIDQFIAATLAYGHMGWLVEEKYGMRQTCRSYYMIQPVQSRYAMEKPTAILYGDNDKLISSSDAFISGAWKNSLLYTKYANGFEIWINGNKTKNWKITAGKTEYTLPPFGWIAVQGNDFLTSSCLVNGKRCDRVSSPEIVFLDGRSNPYSADGINTSGMAAVKKNGNGLSIITVEGVDQLTIGDQGKKYPANDVRSEISKIAKAKEISVEAFDVDGKIVLQKQILKKDDQKAFPNNTWNIPIAKNAIRYEIKK